MAGEREGYPDAAEVSEEPAWHSCAVFAGYKPGGGIVHLAESALLDMQGRGEHGTGIASRQGNGLVVYRGIGLVKDVYSNGKLRGFHTGNEFAVGGNRYGTDGGPNENDPNAVAPEIGRSRRRNISFALTNNGNVSVSPVEWRSIGLKERPITDTVYMTELLGYILDNTELSPADALKFMCRELDGGFSLAVDVMEAEKETLFAARDIHGFWPLWLGKDSDGGVFVASEVGGLIGAGATFEREIERGELLQITKDGVRSSKIFSKKELSENPESRCFLGIAYMDEENNIVFEESIARYRARLGEEAARIFMRQSTQIDPPRKVDVVMAVPDSGIFAAVGFHRESGIPIGMGIKKKKHTGRGFQAPDADRATKILTKYRFIKDEIEGRSIALVDDSVVRGDTTKATVERLFDNGAEEVHVVSTTPRIIGPCFYGVNIRSEKELVAARRTDAEVALEIGANSITYLPVGDLERKAVVGNAAGRLCTGCMNLNYPTSRLRRTLPITKNA